MKYSIVAAKPVSRSVLGSHPRISRALVMAVPQVIVVALLAAWDRPVHAGIVAALAVAQLVLMKRFLADPKEKAIWYSGLGVTLYVLGMLAAAFAVRGLTVGA